MIRTIRSGNVIEKSQFFVGSRRPRQDRKKGSSTLSKMDANMNQAVRRLARILNCNFTTKDLLVTLTYDDEHIPASIEEADKACSLFMRRLNRELALSEVKARSVWVTADKDSKTGKPVRLHHHIVLSGDGIILKTEGKVLNGYVGIGRNLTEVWKAGFVNIEQLSQQDDYTPIAAYLVKQTINVPDAKKWHTSRGMEKPVLVSETIVECSSELKAPGGADVKEVGHYDAETGTHYIRYIRKQKEPAGKEEELKRKFINRYGNRGYKLPPDVQKRARWLIKDYPRIKMQYEEMLYSSPESDGQPRGTKISDPTGDTAVMLSAYTDDIRAVEKALKALPAEYAGVIYRHIVYGKPYASYANEKTWKHWTQVFYYLVAVNRGY